jgi:hypothetical protein
MLRRVQIGTCVLAISAGCADLTRPSSDRLPPPTAAEPVLHRPVLRPRVPPAEPAAEQPAAEQPAAVEVAGVAAVANAAVPLPADQVGASHILISYQGAQRARPTVTRSKSEARRLAESIRAEAVAPGADFAALARRSSDGPSGPRDGALGRFSRRAMVKPFSDAAFALEPDQVSGVVETVFGFHVIKRTE